MSMCHQQLLKLNCKISEKSNITYFQTKEEDGKYYFICQHGEEECYANKIHACTIDAMKNSTLSVQVTNCMIIDNMDADAALARVNILVIIFQILLLFMILIMVHKESNGPNVIIINNK